VAQIRFKELNAAAVNLTRAKNIATKHAYMPEMNALVVQTERLIK
jgi:hypothetical protein